MKDAHHYYVELAVLLYNFVKATVKLYTQARYSNLI